MAALGWKSYSLNPRLSILESCDQTEGGHGGPPLQLNLDVGHSMIVLETERLFLRRMDAGDAEFILTLLNEPSFLRYIGDKKVRTIQDAEQYILNGPVASYERHGFGLGLVELKETHTPIGMCGLLKRERTTRAGHRVRLPA